MRHSFILEKRDKYLLECMSLDFYLLSLINILFVKYYISRNNINQE